MRKGSVYKEGNNIFFNNNHCCGRLEYDHSWDTWRFIPASAKQTFDAGFLTDIARLMRCL